MAFFTHLPPFQFYSVTFPELFTKICQFYSVTFPVLFNKNKKLWNDRKGDFLHIWLFQRIRLYQGRYKVTSLDTIEFLDTRVCIDNPHCQNSGIKLFLCKYCNCKVISDTLTRFFLGCALFVSHCNILELLEKPRRND